MSNNIVQAPSLDALLQDPNTTIATVQEQLRSLDFEDRLAACMKLGKKAQRRLYQLSVDEPCTLESMVPADIPPRTEVILEGKNSLPIFTRFEKRFCWAEGDDKVLYGYNEGFTRKFIGPGYFVAHLTNDPRGDTSWVKHGASVVNYLLVPPSQDAVVEGWPKVVPNTRGLQYFVYRGMTDFMHKVTDDVSIGAAFKGEKDMDSYFVLVRRPIGA